MPGTSHSARSRTFGTQTRQSGSARIVRSPRDKGVQVGTYPDTSEKAKLVKSQKEMFPNIKKANNEVFLFMRGKKESIQRIRNALVVEKRGVESFKGQFVGISDNIERYEGDCYTRSPEQCIAIFRFQDSDTACRWTEHERSRFKQKDFPTASDELEIFAVPIHYIPLDELCAFQLTEMYGMMVDSTHFSENYVKPVAPMMDKRHIYHGVVASNNVMAIRNCQIKRGTFILVNCAKSIDVLKEHYYSSEYAQYREYRHKCMAENDTCFFTIGPYST